MVETRGVAFQEERGKLGLVSVGKGLRMKGSVKPEGQSFRKREVNLA